MKKQNSDFHPFVRKQLKILSPRKTQSLLKECMPISALYSPFFLFSHPFSPFFMFLSQTSSMTNQTKYHKCIYFPSTKHSLSAQPLRLMLKLNMGKSCFPRKLLRVFLNLNFYHILNTLFLICSFIIHPSKMSKTIALGVLFSQYTQIYDKFYDSDCFTFITSS